MAPVLGGRVGFEVPSQMLFATEALRTVGDSAGEPAAWRLLHYPWCNVEMIACYSADDLCRRPTGTIAIPLAYEATGATVWDGGGCRKYPRCKQNVLGASEQETLALDDGWVG